MNRKLSRSFMLLCVLVLLPSCLAAQELSRPSADEFLKLLFNGSPNIAAFADAPTLAMANRLGITYTGVPAKFLISYDFEEEIRERVRDGRTHYTSVLKPCGGGYQCLTVQTDRPHVVREFYFRDGRMKSPFFYHTAGWRTVETKYFRFIISDTSLTNRYAMESLDRFVVDMSSLLEFTDAELAALGKQKILYYLCSDEDEIERLTGYRTRGMFNLAYDAIVSTYNSHKHELAHLLINYKARSGKIYCNPFLLEGFAVGVGGRGGIGADVAASLGSFLDESGMLSYTELLTRDGFNAVDPSMSYPAAGLYHSFLLKFLGGSRYLELYRRHCGGSDDECVKTLTPSELPPVETWKAFLEKYRTRAAVRFRLPTAADSLLYRSDSVSVYRGDDDYVFKIRDVGMFGKGNAERGYRSKKFSELLPTATYRRYKYLITADSQSVSVYNLLTNDLIAGYTASFTLPPKSVPVVDGMFCFSIPAGVFDKRSDALFGDQTDSLSESSALSSDADADIHPDSYDIWLGAGVAAGMDRYHRGVPGRQFFLDYGGYNGEHSITSLTASYWRIPIPEINNTDFMIKDALTMLQVGINGKTFVDPMNSYSGGYYGFGGGAVLAEGHYADDYNVLDKAGRLFRLPGFDFHGALGFALGRLSPMGTTFELSPGCIFWIPIDRDAIPLPSVYYYMTLRVAVNYSIGSWK